jgi:N-acetylmuramoyl-L-alanine amidase
VLWLLLGPGARAAGTVELRDIALKTTPASAVISLSVSGPVQTVVIERREKGVAEVRMRSITAGRSALNSALSRLGVRSVKAHIERKDVLVLDVAFTREVLKLQVIRRDHERVDVRATLGDRLDAPSSTPLASSSRRPKAKTDTKNDGSSKSAGARERIRFPLPEDVSLESKRKWSLRTIVIDPGHGGKDPGALGIGGVKEKDVTLSVARKLRDEIKRRMPEIKVIMTRSDDTFIELYRRGQIANQAGGRLFISLHCNSMPTKPHPATGFECYILRPGKSDDAARVAAAENSAIRFESDKGRYAKMEAESAIMASMAQSAFVRYSEQLAKAMRGALKGRTDIPDKGVHQAGFFVLVGASMPAMLLELGYLSNENDVQVLTDADGQTRLAKGIFQGIKEYEKIYSASLK